MDKKLLFIFGYGFIGLPFIVLGWFVEVFYIGYRTGRYHAAVLMSDAIKEQAERRANR